MPKILQRLTQKKIKRNQQHIKRKINKTLRNKGQVIQAHPNLHKTWHSL